MIRFQRTGRENLATYRLVVAEKARPVKGKILEALGHYLPQRTPHVLQYDEGRIRHWVTMGATVSDSAARVLTRAGVKGMDAHIRRYTKKRKKSDLQSEAEATPATETPKMEEKK